MHPNFTLPRKPRNCRRYVTATSGWRFPVWRVDRRFSAGIRPPGFAISRNPLGCRISGGGSRDEGRGSDDFGAICVTGDVGGGDFPMRALVGGGGGGASAEPLEGWRRRECHRQESSVE